VIGRVIALRDKEWNRHVVHVGNALDVGGRIILKWISEK
jgi:hypothetical protein